MAMDAETKKAIDELKSALAEKDAKIAQLLTFSLKTDAQKAAEAAMAADAKKRAETKAAAIKVAGPGATVLRYVVGNRGYYREGQLYKPGEVIEQPVSDDVRFDPGLDWKAWEPSTRREQAKSNVTTFSQIAAAENAKPKTGPLAPAKGRPQDQEV